jgi:hypothetical protein
MPRRRNQAEEQQEAVVTREPGDEPEREPFPPQRGWKHDNAAGVERLTYTDTDTHVYEFWLKFRDGKPSEAVRTYMKDNGFRWAPDAPSGGRWPEVKGAWVRPIDYATQSQDRLHGERVFDRVVEMICTEKGIAPETKVGGPTPF